MKLLKRTWADVNLDNLAYNFTAIRSRFDSNTKMLAVMKADAYGHGAVPMSHKMVELGAEYLAVSNLEEAVQIRRGEVRAPILILGYTPPTHAEMMVFMDITQEIHSLAYAKQLDAALSGTNYILNVHLKIDTGMTRLGFCAGDEDLHQQLKEVAALQHLHIEGVFTHFSSADSLCEEDVAYTRMQFSAFQSVLQQLDALNVHPEIRHCCNSGATLLYPEFAMDMIRPGILTYGVHPSQDTKDRMELRPVMTLRSILSQVRDVKAGSQISYGRTVTAQRDFRMGVVAIGYADGLNRALSGKGTFLIRGREVPLIGRICMDMCMVDVTDVPDVSVNDTVTIFGTDGEKVLSCDAIAEKTGTIAYEVLCGVNKRIPRIYLSGGKQSSILQYIV